jgi:hypothetical protein
MSYKRGNYLKAKEELWKFTDFKFSFAKVGCGLGYPLIICKCWISFVRLGIYFANFEWLFQILNFHLQRLVVVWGTLSLLFANRWISFVRLGIILRILNGYPKF